jgi:hypothetical protein
MAESREDLWGEAAIRSSGGPSYEFFRDLLPPLRYVNTAFRHYPIELSAARAPVKARWVGSGSGINLRADKPPMWKEVGTPVAFAVGDRAEPFGSELERLSGPHYHESFLPVLTTQYSIGNVSYKQHAFAAVRGAYAEHGAVFLRFVATKPGRVSARIGSGEKFTAVAGAVLDANGRTVVCFRAPWTWDAGRAELVARVTEREPGDLVVLTKPAESLGKSLPSFNDELGACTAAWKILLDRGSRFELPEAVVQNAWRALVIGNFMTAVGDRMHYSAGNAYDHLYEAECGDAVRALLLFGHAADARRMLGPLLDFDRKATRFHVAGHKLQLLAHYYWVTRDRAFLNETRVKWEASARLIRESRKTGNGLLPKDNYAGDVNTQVYSLNSNAACWRGLRDLAAVLEDTGEWNETAALRAEAAAFREAILAATSASVRAREQFIPVALLGDEPAHDPLTATRQGSYYDLIIPYVLDSGVFGPGDPREGWIIDYLRTHGGLAMGMIRSTPHQGEFNNEPGVNVLYGLRYNLTLLRRGDRDHAQVAFYGHLAQGMTLDTFIGGEGSRFFHGDMYGRSFYLPPNTASNAAFLTTLRYLLIQDWDLDDDGRPETLRLCDAIPARWLGDAGSPKRIRIENAPSAFGGLNFAVDSRPKQGQIVVDLEAPPRPPTRWTLRLPDPAGYRTSGARVGDVELKRDASGRVDLSGRTGRFQVIFSLESVR